LEPAMRVTHRDQDIWHRRRAAEGTEGSLTRRWRKPDSNSQSHPRERVSSAINLTRYRRPLV
jgi:hypothetical protein